MSFLKFPDNFYWGAATAAHQIEGNNVHSDWWVWETEFAGKDGGPKERSGIACDSYNRYEEDFTLAKSLNHNAHRMSIEWARIEPQEGIIDEREIEHYRKVLKSLKSKGMSTFVTLWHFSLPHWLRDKKGWGNLLTPMYFARYSKLVAERLGEHIDFFITLNEPQAYVALRHLVKLWIPSMKTTFLDFLDGWVGLIRGHNASYKAIKEVNPSYQVGIVENIMYMEPKRNTLWNKFMCDWRKFIQFRLFFAFTLKNSDFLGVNYYFHDVIGPGDYFINMSSIETTGEVSDWGWQIYPEGIYHIVKELCCYYDKPIFITENGLADAKDEKRESFIVRHLYYLQKAISEGVCVNGYFHWTLMDNFEWAEGYIRKFGLIEIDRENNLERKIRPSAYTYARICKENGIGEDLLKEFNLE